MPSCSASDVGHRPRGAVQAHPISNGFLVDDQAHNRVANSYRYIGKHCKEEKLLLGECARPQGGQRWWATS